MQSASKGFSLVEVLIALALVAVTSTGVLALMTNMNKYLKSADNKSVEMMLISDIAQTFSDKDQCKKAITLKGPQFVDLNNPLKLTASLPGGSSISEGAIYQNSIVLKEFYVDSFESPVDTAVAGQKKTIGTVWIKTEDKSTSGISRRKKNIGLLSVVYKSTNNEIVDCFSLGISPNTNCTSLGFEWDAGTQTCKQQPSKSCVDIGGTWVANKCTISSIDNSLSILNKTCSGVNVALVGFDGSGNPKCQQIVGAGPPPPGPPGPPPPGPPPGPPPPGPAKFCPGGFTDINSNDGSNKCHFEWGSIMGGTSTSCAAGMTCTNGGTVSSANCGLDGTWAAVLYSCPNKGAMGSTCTAGFNNNVKSLDGSNTCEFAWGQAEQGQSIVVTKSTNGGTLSGTCGAGGAWSFFFNCPGKAVTCPGGNYSAGKCLFAWDLTPAGSPASNLRDVNGKGSASGFFCKADGTWDNSKGVISGCD